MDWFIYSLISLIAFSIYGILSRVLSVKSNDPRAFSVLFNLMCAGICAILFILLGEKVTTLPSWVILMTILITIVYGVFTRAEFFGSKLVEASTKTVLSQVAPLTATILAIVFLGEQFDWLKALAIGLIIIGNIIAIGKQLQNGDLPFEGLVYVLVTEISLAIAWTIDKSIASFYPLFLYLFITYLMPAIYNLLTPPIKPAVLKAEIKEANWKIVLLAITQVVGYYCLVKALTIGEASRVVFISASSAVVTMLLGIFLLNEKGHLWKKLLGGLIVFIGVVMLRGI